MHPLEDTVAAIATPPGEGGIAIVRVSGPGAAETAARILRTRSGEVAALQPAAIRVAVVRDPTDGQSIDEVVALWMPGPASYTREDVLELQCHGGHAAARRVLEAVLSGPARLAEPGEFTLRAYLRGRIDLLQAEAVLDVIQARTAEALAVQERLLEGHLSQEAHTWQDVLARALVPIEAHLDFPEEADLDPFRPQQVLALLASVTNSMEAKLASFAWGRTQRDGFTVALVGAPNTGKSSILNRLLGEDRVIVSATPGTTRDTVEAWIDACGLPVRLVDTAGLRVGSDPVETEGVRRAQAAASNSDLVLFVSDGSRPLTESEASQALELTQTRRTLPLLNKVDLGSAPAARLAAIFARPPIVLSALTGEGVRGLLAALREAAWSGLGPAPEAPLTRQRHRDCVGAALAAVGRASQILREDGYLELAASEVHAARRHLESLLGVGTPEDVLRAIFDEFCIGK